MAQFGKYFEYNGHTSQEYNLMLASFDEIDEYASGMERDVQRGEMNRYRFKPNHFGMSYSNTLEFDITFIKDMCNGADMAFTRSEYRAIVDWLSEPEYPSLYHMTDYEESWADEEEDYFGVFSNIQNHASGEVIGITATFTCDSPFAWSPIRTVTFEGNDAQIINIDADVEYTYPQIVITPHSTTDIAIKNITEDRELDLTPLAKNDIITIDCEKLTITDYIGSNIYLSDLGIYDPQYLYWPKLLKGENEIQIDSDATIVFTYREARKVGAY